MIHITNAKGISTEDQELLVAITNAQIETHGNNLLKVIWFGRDSKDESYNIATVLESRERSGISSMRLETDLLFQNKKIAITLWNLMPVELERGRGELPWEVERGIITYDRPSS